MGRSKKYDTEAKRQAAVRENKKRYIKSPKGRATSKRYRHSIKGRAAYNKYRKKCNLKRYNLTLDEYDQILTKQNYCCAMCKRHQSKFKIGLVIDHDHKTGKFRGLLCVRCNTGLYYLETEGFVENAMIYLGN